MSSQTQTADVAMVDTSHDLHLFDQATSDIQNTISENHRQDFLCNASASLLLDELQASFTSTSICDQRLVACSQKFALLVQNFAPYFEILALCVQLRSEWASWLWGTIRLVFRISSNHPVFLEKAADMLETIAHIVSPYRQMYEGCNRNGPVSHLAVQDLHLAALMSNVYADIVCLCLDLYKIFCRSARGMNQIDQYYGDLWITGSHDSRYDWSVIGNGWKERRKARLKTTRKLRCTGGNMRRF